MVNPVDNKATRSKSREPRHLGVINVHVGSCAQKNRSESTTTIVNIRLRICRLVTQLFSATSQTNYTKHNCMEICLINVAGMYNPFPLLLYFLRHAHTVSAEASASFQNVQLFWCIHLFREIPYGNEKRRT